MPPLTRSTARAAGWQWQIPLQHRTGNGHVFASSFIGEAEAADALMRSLPTTALAEPRLLRFEAGRRLRSWRGNCLAVGLSSGFLEPLESTSIYLIQVAAMNFVKLFPGARNDPALAAEFNRLMDIEYERIRDFLILHYHANTRDDAELWRYCRNMEVPESLAQRLALFVHRGHIEQYRHGLFTPPSWLSLYLGQGVRPAGFHPLTEAVPLERLLAELKGLREEIAASVDAMSSHEEMIAEHFGALAPPAPGLIP